MLLFWSLCSINESILLFRNLVLWGRRVWVLWGCAWTIFCFSLQVYSYACLNYGIFICVVSGSFLTWYLYGGNRSMKHSGIFSRPPPFFFFPLFSFSIKFLWNYLLGFFTRLILIEKNILNTNYFSKTDLNFMFWNIILTTAAIVLYCEPLEREELAFCFYW